MSPGRGSHGRAGAEFLANSRVIDTLYAAVADPLGWPGALGAIGELFNAAGAAMVFLDEGAPHIGLALGTGAWDAAVIARYNEFAPYDPAPPAFARQQRGTATTTDRMFTPRQARGGLFYNEFFRPLGLVECAGGVLFAEGGRFSLLGIHRAPDRGAFADAELRRIEVLMPHIRRAFQLRATLLRANVEARALAAAADRMPMGLAVIAAEHGGLHVNAALRAMATRGDGLKLDAKGWVRAEAREPDKRLVALQTDVLARWGPGGVVAIARAAPDGGRDMGRP